MLLLLLCEKPEWRLLLLLFIKKQCSNFKVCLELSRCSLLFSPKWATVVCWFSSHLLLFSKEKTSSKTKRQLAQIIKTRSPAYIDECTVYTYTVYIYTSPYSIWILPALPVSVLHLGSYPVRAYTSTYSPTTLTPAKIEKYTRQPPYLYPCQNIASPASNKR